MIAARPLRLPPGADLRAALQQALIAQGGDAGFVVAGIGSLSVACLRLAGAADAPPRTGDFEILTLSGTVCRDHAHLHASLADAQGRVVGGHVAAGCIVRTTAEVLLALLPDWRFTREPDAATGYAELVVQPAEVQNRK